MVCLAFFRLIELFYDPYWNHTFIAKSTIKRIEDVIDFWIDINNTLFFDFDEFIEEIFKEICQILINVHNIVLHMIDKLLHEGIDITIVSLNE